MTLGKGIGGGVPLGALLATDAASCFEHGEQGGTYNGNPLMCAAGLAVFNQVADRVFSTLWLKPGRRCGEPFKTCRCSTVWCSAW